LKEEEGGTKRILFESKKKKGEGTSYFWGNSRNLAVEGRRGYLTKP